MDPGSKEVEISGLRQTLAGYSCILLGIEVRPGGQGQNLAGFWVYGNHSRRFRGKFFHGFIQFPFHDMLDDFINGQD